MNRTENEPPKPGKYRKQPGPEAESVAQSPKKHHRQRHRLQSADGGDHPQKEQRPEGQSREQQIQKHRKQSAGELPSQWPEKVEHPRQDDAQHQTDTQQPCLGVDGNDHPNSL